MSALAPIPVSASAVTLSGIMPASDANLLGTIHGGRIMHWVDEAAGAAAARHGGGAAVTAAMDSMAFLAPVHIGDLLTVAASVNWSGSTSMEVGVRVTTQRWNQVGEPVHVASAYLVFVAVDDELRPRPVAPLLLENDTQRRRWDEALMRRRHRLAARAEILASRA